MTARPLIAAAAIAASAVHGPAADAGSGDARVIGTFTMTARITAAVNVPGERVGEVVVRRWTIEPQRCRGDVCASLVLDRQRSDALHSRLTLRRTGPGRYAGSGAFWVALSCRGRVDPHGSQAPYRITLRITRAAAIGGVQFARAVRATYVNLERTDRTRCPLGPSHDAATYAGPVTAGLPTAPVASFSVRIHQRTGKVRFHGTSKPGRGNGRIVSRRWSFGDPRPRSRNTSTRSHPRHIYAFPGRYQVTLVIRTADGLTATTTRTIRLRARPRRVASPSRAPRRAR